MFKKIKTYFMLLLLTALLINCANQQLSLSEQVEPQTSNSILVDNGDHYLLGGDIILQKDDPNHQGLIDVLSGKTDETRGFFGKNVEPWPDGKIDYYFNNILESHQLEIRSAMDEWEAVCKVRFTEQSQAGSNILTFNKYNSDLTFATSTLGKVNNATINIYFNNYPLPINIKGVMMHELGHTLGFWHEHQRFDRDKYVTYHEENVINDDLWKYQFIIIPEAATKYLFKKGLYDYDSIMHYPHDAFSANDQPTLDSHGYEIGNRTHLSEIDKFSARYIYGDPETDIISRILIRAPYNANTGSGSTFKWHKVDANGNDLGPVSNNSSKCLGRTNYESLTMTDNLFPEDYFVIVGSEADTFATKSFTFYDQCDREIDNFPYIDIANINDYIRDPGFSEQDDFVLFYYTGDEVEIINHEYTGTITEITTIIISGNRVGGHLFTPFNVYKSDSNGVRLNPITPFSNNTQGLFDNMPINIPLTGSISDGDYFVLNGDESSNQAVTRSFNFYNSQNEVISYSPGIEEESSLAILQLSDTDGTFYLFKYENGSVSIERKVSNPVIPHSIQSIEITGSEVCGGGQGYFNWHKVDADGNDLGAISDNHNSNLFNEINSRMSLTQSIEAGDYFAIFGAEGSYDLERMFKFYDSNGKEIYWNIQAVSGNSADIIIYGPGSKPESYVQFYYDGETITLTEKLNIGIIKIQGLSVNGSNGQDFLNIHKVDENGNDIETISNSVYSNLFSTFSNIPSQTFTLNTKLCSGESFVISGNESSSPLTRTITFYTENWTELDQITVSAQNSGDIVNNFSNIDSFVKFDYSDDGIEQKVSQSTITNSVDPIFHSKLESDASWTSPAVCEYGLTPSIFSNGPNTYPTGKFGKANHFEKLFDGHERTLFISTTEKSLPPEGSMEFWAQVGKPQTETDTRLSLNIPGLDMQIVHKDQSMQFITDAGTPSERKRYVGQVGEWQHVYITWSKTGALTGNKTMRVWVNGVVRWDHARDISASTQWRFDMFSLKNRIGYVNFALDNVKIYNKILTENSFDVMGRYQNPVE